ncbi:MAG: transketolase C-terminal domain-containing protein [Planctomycetota bacterium]
MERQAGPRPPIALGRAELVSEGGDGLVIACGTLLGVADKAAAALREEGLEVTVINARFVKPLDTALLLERIEAAPWTLTVEENALPTGFGSAVLEMVSDAGLAAGPIQRLGLPDRFVEHGERGELLAELGLDATGIAAACRRLAGRDPRRAAAISHAAVDR